jgi:hypothetical protein
MRTRIRDAILVITVGASLIATGWAFHDLGDVPPPPEVHSTPAPVVAPEAEH